MTFPDDQLDELRTIYGNAHQWTEGASAFVLIRNIRPLQDRDGVCDVILVPEPCDGYPSRLFYSERVSGPIARNWNGNRQFLERSWFSFSWHGVEVAGQRLITLIRQHLRGLVTP